MLLATGSVVSIPTPDAALRQVGQSGRLLLLSPACCGWPGALPGAASGCPAGALATNAGVVNAVTPIITVLVQVHAAGEQNCPIRCQ
ncbi:hypothetical protein [Streptomyces cahuitamycinicus]|uniref:hypothetical protein n=1 Tax=Streptomyces cahuitamycinicus TaxID=2070367 RepID=UPI0011AF8648|nr:hypothetical protein [Streptomyces cahuitamycinicus]